MIFIQSTNLRYLEVCFNYEIWNNKWDRCISRLLILDVGILSWFLEPWPKIPPKSNSGFILTMDFIHGYKYLTPLGPLGYLKRSCKCNETRNLLLAFRTIPLLSETKYAHKKRALKQDLLSFNSKPHLNLSWSKTCNII